MAHRTSTVAIALMPGAADPTTWMRGGRERSIRQPGELLDQRGHHAPAASRRATARGRRAAIGVQPPRSARSGVDRLDEVLGVGSPSATTRAAPARASSRGVAPSDGPRGRSAAARAAMAGPTAASSATVIAPARHTTTSAAAQQAARRRRPRTRCRRVTSGLGPSPRASRSAATAGSVALADRRGRSAVVAPARHARPGRATAWLTAGAERAADHHEREPVRRGSRARHGPLPVAARSAARISAARGVPVTHGAREAVPGRRPRSGWRSGRPGGSPPRARRSARPRRSASAAAPPPPRRDGRRSPRT